ncbi:CAP domain-containing protein [Flavobacterium sp. LC2016-12]|uniref:CAP domain-containing protein n=1 Tax=Flavobacterium sp. LC2016-12 TaxID=2783794 RepID=UPI00188CE905|nr:CAP domain-containing protein [Flavobacterium sp. LC2016-12]MBF4467673.1 CAP domain-containing protein [Flavobacterium sp. LC2016-12]
MKKKIMHTMLFIAINIAMNSCSADTAEGTESSTPTKTLITDYTYNDSELETMQLINNYRATIGLNALQKINHISSQCLDHNNYMIATNTVNHNDFTARSENIMEVLGATKVGENVAYNYKTSEAVLRAWLESPGHKENIEGNFTHFGIAVTIDPATGKKYYTNIFVKI